MTVLGPELGILGLDELATTDRRDELEPGLLLPGSMLMRWHHLADLSFISTARPDSGRGRRAPEHSSLRLSPISQCSVIVAVLIADIPCAASAQAGNIVLVRIYCFHVDRGLHGNSGVAFRTPWDCAESRNGLLGCCMHAGESRR